MVEVMVQGPVRPVGVVVIGRVFTSSTFRQIALTWILAATGIVLEVGRSLLKHFFTTPFALQKQLPSV